MTDFERSERLDAKHERNRRERLDGIERWVQYVQNQPPDVWGAEQNALVETQLESARESGISTAHRRRVREFGETAADGADDDGS